ncbi:MAG: winged helix-turn-helix transcriptional regulator [Candidatus Andersenbacteria bacterium]|nr:winged helix-turn-helix transcriptional regulator [Candidatus Andersenbacteria bacterium]MBI3250465.1 winged helix-turn-helix transcriptional regulator [Candidatus Andersenbacteria bacterium]
MDSPKKTFPLEKIFGSRTRVKIITLFTTGVKRPYFVREIARIVGERLNAVRRELTILQNVGMLDTYDERRRKYYTVKEDFILYSELGSIMQKAGPGIQDVLFNHLENVGDVHYAAVSGYFTAAKSAPTDLLVVGAIEDNKLQQFANRIEQQINREISYTPMTVNEYQYRLNFSDVFLRQFFGGAYKELINKLPQQLQPDFDKQRSTSGVVTA